MKNNLSRCFFLIFFCEDELLKTFLADGSPFCIVLTFIYYNIFRCLILSANLSYLYVQPRWKTFLCHLLFEKLFNIDNKVLLVKYYQLIDINASEIDIVAIVLFTFYSICHELLFIISVIIHLQCIYLTRFILAILK